MIDNNINIAALKRTVPPMVEGWQTAAANAKDGKEKVAAAAPAPTHNEPAVGSTDPIKPNPVKAFTMHADAIRTASLPTDNRKLPPAPATANPTSVTTMAVVKQDPPPPPGARPGILGVLPAKLASASNSVPAATSEPAAKPRSGGWMIQIGAFDDEKEAKERLVAAQDKAKDQLAQADPFTERVAKGDKSLYRARFAGLDKDQAETACKHLKRSEIPCMLLKN
jgi:D-alanyl-D-alanine carboxypeptidase